MTAIHPQFIKAGQEELVVLTRAEFDMLMSLAEGGDDVDDIALFDARMADLANGKDAPLPPGVNAALLRGKSLLEGLRLWRGLDLAEVASRAGIDPSRLVALEDRQAAVTDDEAKRLAGAFAVDAGMLA